MGDTVAILGAGKMGEALLSGLLRSGYDANDVVFVERYDERADVIAKQYGIARHDVAGAVGRADTLLVAVKPTETTALLDEITALGAGDKLVISIVAGLSCATLEGHLPAGTPVVRVMPNTPALVNEGMSAVAPGINAGEEHLQRAEALLEPVGKVVRVTDDQLDAVTAVSGSGPAYFFYFVEAIIDAGISLGLSATLAKDLAIQTVVGAGVMMRDSGDEPGKLRKNVTSPNGTTAAALRSFDEHDMRESIRAGLEACRDRSREIAADAS
ncbi:MAG TPA: pyrroline-5-carboxylate reductase [Mycobacteriales bacterium]|nr:pyrroline-5-carboxylate reductase [Mycobacteriales bacterium]